MRRLLIRSGKSPFHATTPAEYLHQDLMGTNTGNLLFSDAAHRLLSTPSSEVTSNGIRTDPSPERAAEINAGYDAFVVPLANAFRPTFRASLDRLSTLIEQLTIPVVVLGVGAQVGTDGDFAELQPMEPSVRRFVTCVLERSASIGVRGELTAAYLGGLGYRDVDIIGCPSMFMYGPALPQIRTPEQPFAASSRIALNLSPDAIPVGDVVGLAARAQARFPNATYFAQNITDAETLFWGDTSREAGTNRAFPNQLRHPLFQSNQVAVPLDPKTWIDDLSDYDFAYGTRIHGNMAALLAGTPAVVLAHDSRTLELCRYFELPYRMLADLPPDLEPELLYEAADFVPMANGHRERYQRLITFLTKNNLENTYDHGDAGSAFDTRMAGLCLPASLREWDGTDDGALRYRISRLRELHDQSSRRISALGKRNDQLRTQLAAAKKADAALSSRVSDLERDLTAANRRLAAAENTVSTIDRRLLVRIGPTVRRRIRRLGRRGPSDERSEWPSLVGLRRARVEGDGSSRQGS